MADVSDVEKALAALIATELFPGPGGGYGAGAGYAQAGGYGPLYAQNKMQGAVSGFSVQVARGWPLSNVLDTALRNKSALVTVFPLPNATRIVTRYARNWETVSQLTPTLTATASSNTVTFGGDAGVSQVVGIGYRNVGYSYRLTTTDTALTVAAAFASSIPGATASGAVLTLPGSGNAYALVVADSFAIMELRRQEQRFRVTIWAPDPVSRDVLAGLIDPIFPASRSLLFPDGSVSGPINYHGSSSDDQTEKAGLYRRDLMLSVEYATVQRQVQPCMLFGIGTITVPNAGVIATFGTEEPVANIYLDQNGNVLQGQAAFLLANPGF